MVLSERKPVANRAQDQPSTVNNTAPVIRDKKYVCRFCKVEVCGKSDLNPIMGHEHKKSCPRRRMYN